MNLIISLMSFYFLIILHLCMPYGSKEGNCMIRLVHVAVCSLSFPGVILHVPQAEFKHADKREEKCYQEDWGSETFISADKFGDFYEVKHQNTLSGAWGQRDGGRLSRSAASHRLNKRANMHHSQTWSNSQTSWRCSDQDMIFQNSSFCENTQKH